MNEANLAGFIQQIIGIKERTDQVLDSCFKNRKSLRQEQSQAFKKLLNHEHSSDRNAQLLAIYINWALKHEGHKLLADDHEHVLSLFRSLNSSDVFEKTYLRQLAARLLCKTGYDLDQEKKLASTLKPECSENFATQTELMFANTAESEALTQSFISTHSKLAFADFTIKVIEQKTWPIDTQGVAAIASPPPDTEEQKGAARSRPTSSVGAKDKDATQATPSKAELVGLPKPLSDVFNSFAKFYKEQFRGKRLDIVY